MDRQHRGARLKARRRALGLKQKDLAREAGLSVTYLSELENGKKEGKMGAWNRLAGALGLEVTALYSGAPAGQPPDRIPVVGTTGGDPDASFKWEISEPLAEAEGLEIVAVRAVRVVGRGLDAVARDGQHVLYTEEAPEDGELCVCSMGGRIYFKRFYRGRRSITLVSIAGGRPLTIKPSELDWAHRMVGVIFDRGGG